MKKIAFSSFLFGLLWLFIAPQEAKARLHTKIYVKERLGYHWKREWISQDWKAQKGQCRPGMIRLQNGGRAVPFQLNRVRFWPGGRWVRSARVHLITSLGAGKSKVFQLHCGVATPRTQTQLRVRKQKGQLWVYTPHLDAVFPQEGNTKVNKAPTAPLLRFGLRQRGKVLWLGTGAWYGKLRPRSIQVKVLSEGPLFFRIQMHYLFAHWQVTLKATIRAGSSQIFWHSIIKRTSKARVRKRGGWELRFANRYRGMRLLLVKGQRARKGSKKRHRIYGVAPWASVARRRPGKVMQLSPWREWFYKKAQTWWAIDLPGLSDDFEVSARSSRIWRAPRRLGTIRTPWIYTQKLPSLFLRKNKQISLRFPNQVGQRAWQWGTRRARIGDRLQQLRRQRLVWRHNLRHPRLFTTAQRWRTQASPLPAKTLAALAGASGAFWARLEKAHPSPKDILGRIRFFYKKGGIYQARKGLDALTAKASAQLGKQARLDLYLELLLDSALRYAHYEEYANAGLIDFFRLPSWLIRLYDFVIDGGWLTPTRQRLLRAKMVAFAFLLERTEIWSSERGYGTGNLDMHYAFNINRGLMGLLFQSHTRAKAWRRYADAWLQHYLRSLGPRGEPHENSHYMVVTLLYITGYLVAAHNSGLSGLLRDPRWKKNLTYMMHAYTPPDPRFSNQRALASWNRASNGFRPIFPGVFAQLYRRIDPRFSARLQALWRASGTPNKSHELNLAGLEPFLLSKTHPHTPLRLSSTHNRVFTAMRSNYGSSQEHAAMFLHEGGHILNMFAFGKPLSTVFTAQFEKLLRALPFRSAVTSVHPWWKSTRKRAHADKLKRVSSSFAALPRQDALSLCQQRLDLLRSYRKRSFVKNVPRWPLGKPTRGRYLWCRQVLAIKDPAPGGAHYYVMRDSIEGKQPTQWLMWTLSQGIYPAGRVQRRRLPRFLNARKLKQSNQYTAAGQHGVDLEYFIASPAKTPRYTLRWSHQYPKNFNKIPEGLSDTQDLLILRLPSAGAYHVVLFPHRRNQRPRFRRFAGGRIVRVSGSFGTDYTFLSRRPQTKARAEQATFTGTAGSVQQRRGRLTLALGAEGAVQYKGYQIRGPASSATWTSGRLRVTIAPGARTREVVFRSPRKASLPSSARRAGARLRIMRNGWARLRFPKRRNQIDLSL